MYIGTQYNNSYYSSLYSNAASLYSKNSNVSDFIQSLGITQNNKYNSDGIKFVQSLKSNSASISSSIKSLAAGKQASKLQAYSSDPSVLSASISDNKYLSVGAPDSISLKIDQIASAQINSGSKLNADALVGKNAYQTFEIDSNGSTTRLSVSISESDSNLDMQQKMADAINNSGLDLKASVSFSDDGKYSTLSIQSLNTGAGQENRFSLRDVGNSSIVSDTGANKVSQEAQDAIYSIDGSDKRSSSSNTISLGYGIEATLLKASSNEVNVQIRPDNTDALDAVQDLVDSYNNLYSLAANKGDDDPKAMRLFNGLVGISKTYKNSLAQIGIGFDKDGKMSIDSDRLNAASADGSLNRFFTENKNSNFGFTNRLQNLADDVQNNTARYVSSSNFDEDEQKLSAFGSAFNKLFGSPNSAQFLNVGMLLDMFI